MPKISRVDSFGKRSALTLRTKGPIWLRVQLRAREIRVTLELLQERLARSGVEAKRLSLWAPP